MNCIICTIYTRAIECISISVNCFDIDIDNIVNIDRTTHIGIYLSAHYIYTLSSIFSPEVVLDYEQPYSYGTNSNPKQLRVEDYFCVFFNSIEVHTD